MGILTHESWDENPEKSGMIRLDRRRVNLQAELKSTYNYSSTVRQQHLGFNVLELASSGRIRVEE